MPKIDETTVTVMNMNTGELMEFTVKTETENTKWTTAAIDAAKAHWKEIENNIAIRSWVYGDPNRYQNKTDRENAEVLQAEYEQERKNSYIDLTPTWSEAAQIIAAAIENGTGEGREAARAELFRMAEILDDLKAEQEAAKAATSTAKKFTVAARNATGDVTAYMHTETVTKWQDNKTSADRLDKAEARQIADDWTSYARSKGLERSYAAIEAEEPEPRT